MHCCWPDALGGTLHLRLPHCSSRVFPANVNMVRLWWDKPWPMRIVALARLPLQIPMITEALKIRRNA